MYGCRKGSKVRTAAYRAQTGHSNQTGHPFDPNGTVAFNVATAGIGAILGGAVNAASAYSKGESVPKGFLVGAGAGAIAEFSMNPMALGAFVGFSTTAGNMATGIDKSCNAKQAAVDLLKAIALGALAGMVSE